MLLSNFIDAFIFFVFIFFQVGLLDPKWVEERDKQITQKVKIKVILERIILHCILWGY